MLSYIISACRKRRFSGIGLTVPDSHRGMSWETFVLRHLGTLACCCIQSVAPVRGFKVRIFPSRLLKSSNEQRERTGLEFSANETEGSIMTWQSDIRSILSWVNLHFVPFRTIRAEVSGLKMQVVCFSETSVPAYKYTRCYNQKPPCFDRRMFWLC